MPRGDRTGPAGMGPMTGGARGYCAGYNAPGYMNPVGGRGLGLSRGRGLGRGFGRGFGRGWAYADPQYYGYPPFDPGYGYAPTGFPGPTPSKEQELEMLASQAKGVEQTLEDIRKRISELESGE